MKTKLFILILLLGASLHSTSQITFQTTLKNGGGGNGFSALQTSDGGYICVGYTANGLSVGSNVFLIKTDASGDTLWTKTYGGPADDAGWFFQPTTDGGFIIIGYTKSFGTGNEDVYLIRTDSIGDLLWSKTYGGTANDRGNCVQQTADGGYIIAGFTESFGAGSTDIFLVKTDANGDTVWTKTFGGAAADLGTAVQQTADGGYIISGVTNSFGTGSGDLFLIKTDFNGDAIWQKGFGDIDYDYGYSVQQTTDGGYIAAGYTASFGAGNDDLYLVKTDSIGDLLWSKTFGGVASDRARSVQQTTDGGYILTGWAYSFGTGDADVYLVKTDANGDAVWTKAIGGSLQDNARSVKQTADGGYVITGGGDSFGTGTYDFYIFKTDANGNSDCNQTSPPTVVTTPTTQVISIANIVSSPAPVVTSPATIVGSGAEVIIACSEVGIDEMAANNSFSIFPNPSAGDFIISFNEVLANGTVEVVNVLGEKVFSENIFNASEKKINLENISPGIYFVRINNNSFQKIIIN